MNFVYLHTTYVLSVLIISLNITYTKLWMLRICPRPTSYLNTISTQKRLALNDEIRAESMNVWVHSLGQFVMKKRPLRKGTDMTRCSLGKFLVVPTFVTKCLHYSKAGRDPSGERWNYFSRRLSCNLP